MEKASEHDDILFVLYVDLKKAYGSVPINALWRVLEKVTVPLTKLQVIRSFHDRMWTDVSVDVSCTDSISEEWAQTMVHPGSKHFKHLVECCSCQVEELMHFSQNECKISALEEVSRTLDSKITPNYSERNRLIAHK